MGLAVWPLYVADRLLDVRGEGACGEGLEARHYFHQRYRLQFLAIAVAAALALATVLPGLPVAALRLYEVEGSLLGVWFFVLHATRSAHRLPKEIVVGLFFAAAVFIPTVARAPELRPSLVPAAVLLAALCSLNCLFIYAWEHEGNQSGPAVPAVTRLALAHLRELTWAVIVCGCGMAATGLRAPRVIPIACALSAALLLALDCVRGRLARTDLRAAADVALLTPALLIPFVR